MAVSEKEKNDTTIIAEAFKQMTEGQKQYFLGYAQAAADMAEKTAGEDSREPETADQPA